MDIFPVLTKSSSIGASIGAKWRRCVWHLDLCLGTCWDAGPRVAKFPTQTKADGMNKKALELAWELTWGLMTYSFNMLTTLAMIRNPSIWWVQCRIRGLPVTETVLQRYRRIYGTCLWRLMQVQEWLFFHSDKSEGMNKVEMEVTVKYLLGEIKLIIIIGFPSDFTWNITRPPGSYILWFNIIFPNTWSFQIPTRFAPTVSVSTCFVHILISLNGRWILMDEQYRILRADFCLRGSAGLRRTLTFLDTAIKIHARMTPDWIDTFFCT